jgi:transposase InsO family protein
VKELLKTGVIQESTSAFASPAILVQKKDLTWCLCIDYWRLNTLTVARKFPLPVIDELIDELTGARWFSKLDLCAGYHQIRLAPGEEYKTAFHTHSGQLEYKVMSFGLSGAPATFQAAMNTTLQSVLRKHALVFFDDILVYSSTLEQHVDHLQSVLALLRRDKWQVKLSKCSFGQNSLAYLGHIINGDGVATDPSKIKEISNWHTPSCVKELRSFLGLAGYYRKFVCHFGVIAKPLTQLLKKNTIYTWSPDADAAFNLLKQSLVSAPVLAIPDFSLPFVVDTDASDRGIGAVLQQHGHPLAYLSKPLGTRTSGLSTYEKEYLAILMAVDHWRAYLQHDEFIIRTDQRSLVHLEEQRLSTPWQKKAFTKLLGLRYRIIYRQGTENSAADALSRKSHEQLLCVAALSVCQPAWGEEVIAGYALDAVAQKLLTSLAIKEDDKQKFSLDNGLIRHQGRLWIGNNLPLQSKIFSAFHSSTLGGHSGAPVTCKRIQKLFSWPGMKKQIHKWVQTCQVCQQAKPERVKYPGLLKPLPVPHRPWQHIALDFVEGLPQSGRYNCLLVVVDRFSRYGHFIPLAHPYTAATVASLFVNHIYKLHGLPETIVSDRDPVFTSRFWQELFRAIGSELKMSTPYHPATNGQTERLNQCVETYLRCFVHSCPKKWSEWISLAEYWYNTNHHSTLNSSPFMVFYGYEPRHWGIEAPGQCFQSSDLAF